MNRKQKRLYIIGFSIGIYIVSIGYKRSQITYVPKEYITKDNVPSDDFEKRQSKSLMRYAKFIYERSN